MPDTRHHRGPHPEDAGLFAASAAPALRSAVSDLSWLLTHDYALPSSLKLVGDRYSLDARQRTAIMRSACSDQALLSRTSRRVDASLAGQRLVIDAYNVLTTIEAALAGAVILRGRDGCCRDLASVHGTWRKVEETRPAIDLAAQAMSDLRTASALWLIDSPVSNSGRLRQALLDHAAGRGAQWDVQLVPDADPVLGQSPDIIATADSVVLDRGGRWFCLADWILRSYVPGCWLVDLGG